MAKFVAQKNAEAPRDQESFTRAGWRMVDVPPPDARLVALDPSLLGTREAELRQQIATTTTVQAANLARIVREAQEDQTRVIPRAAALLQLLDSPDVNRVERKQIAFTLALISLRDRSPLPASVQLSAQARALFDSMTSLATLSH